MPVHTCPLESGWRLWTPFCDPRTTLAPEIIERIERAWPLSRSAARDIPATWEVADDYVSRMPMTVEESHDVEWRFDAAGPWHRHTEFVLDDRLLHIDMFGAIRYGPRSSWVEVRIHVDGDLQGLAAAAGNTLGGNNNTLPAIARAGQHVVIVEVKSPFPGPPPGARVLIA